MQRSLSVQHAVFFVVYWATHLVFLYVYKGQRVLAPDESAYINCFSQVTNFSLDLTCSGGWWASNSIIVYSLNFIPAIAELVLPEVFSDELILRVYSSVLTFVSLKIIFSTSKSTSARLNYVLLIIVVCSPTMLIWSSLALRESFMFLCFALIISSITRITQEIDIIQVTTLLLASIALYAIKPTIFLILWAGLIFGILAHLFKREMRPQFALLLIIMTIPLVLLFSNTKLLSSEILGVTNNSAEFIERMNTRVEKVPLGSFTEHLLNDDTNSSASAQFDALTELIPSKTRAAILSESASQSDLLNKRTLNPALPWSGQEFWKSLVEFLFRPLPYTVNGSVALDVMSIEFLFLVSIYFILVLLFLGIRKVKLELPLLTVIGSILAFLIYSVGTEVNLGTAIRHRIWIYLFVLSFSCLATRYKRVVKSEP